MTTFFQAETPANLEKLPHTNKEYAVKHIFNTQNYARFKGKLFFLMENEGEERSGEKGKENVGTKEEEEGKAAGKRGNSTGKVGQRG